MRLIFRSMFIGSTMLVVIGCNALSVTTPVPDSVAPASDATSVEDFDTTTQAERDAAVTNVAAGEQKIGLTVAALGNAASPGFWLETPLVSEAVMGRVVYQENGKGAAVQLIPIAGSETAGSRISLAALRVLDAPLTGLVELTVFAN